ncbi:MAG: hypothetical protein KAS32_10810 [Candidatus Peribacteraceae bacterium]|nr:hypothetical protein [Candidatus Peribacteraceae bacterium]
MARIPTVRRRVTPSGRVGGVPIPFDITDVGQGLEAEGLATLGKGIGGLAQALGEITIRKNKADDLLSSDNVLVAAQSAKDKFAQFKEDSPDPKTWAEGSTAIWKEALTAANTQQFHDKNIGERTLLRFKAEQEHGLAIANIEASDATTKIAVRATGNTLIKAIASGIDTKIEEAAHREALKNEFGDNDLVDIAMAKTLAGGEKQRISTLVGLGDFAGARELTTKTRGLTPPERIAQINFIDNAEQRAKKAAADLDSAIQDSAMTDMVSQISQNPNAVGAVELEASELSNENKLIFANAINERIAALKEKKPDPWAISSKVVNNALSQLLEGTREEVSKIPVSDIIGRLGDGLTPEEVGGFLELRTKKLDKTNALNNFAVTEALKHVDSLQQIGTLVPVEGEGPLTRELKEVNAQVSLDIRTNFKKWVTNNDADIVSGKITEKDIRAKISDLTRPVEESLSRDSFRFYFGNRKETLKFSEAKTKIKIVTERFPETRAELERNISLILAADPKAKDIRIIAEKYFNRHIGRFQ